MGLRIIATVLLFILGCNTGNRLSTRDAAVGPVDGLQTELAAGDANQDGEADFEDFRILAENFGKDEAADSDGDFNQNGKVDFADFLILSDEFRDE